MARTSSFARLQRLADLGRAAQAQGVDIATAEERQHAFATSEAGLSRRDVLRAGVLLAASASAVGGMALRPSRAFAATGPSSQPRIAIIGAGISGMTAAMTLKDAGFTNVTVYEANNRIGGRTYTRKNDGFFEAGQWVEWGGELIDSNHKLVFTLCQRFGFGTIDLGWHSVSTNGASDILYFDNAYYAWSDMVNDWKAGNVDQKVQADIQALPAYPWPYTATWTQAGLAIDSMTVRDWINTRIPGGINSRLGQFIDVAYNIEFGEETTRQGATDLLGLLGYSNGTGNGAWWVYGKSDERWKIVGGNQQLSLAQADYLGSSNIAMGWQLTSLSRNSNGTASLTFQVGAQTQTVTADRVILAMPLGIMKKLKASGGLAGGQFSSLKLGSIDALGFGADNKLQLQIADRFWTQPGVWGNSDGETYSDTGFQEAWSVTTGQPGTTGIINNYTGGDVSRLLNPSKPFSDTSDPDKTSAAYVKNAAKTFLSQVEPVFPGMTAKWTGKAQLSVWHVNPYSYGAYSYWTPGYMHQYSTIEGVPERPFHFAGEHTSSLFQGYIEGGAEEGQRAANEIVADFK